MISKNTKNKLLALLAIGICDALRKKKIDLLDAERLLFSPHSMQKTSSCDERIVELIHRGTELEDLLSLIPNEYEPAIDRIQQLAMEYLSSSTSALILDDDRWIDSVI